MRRLKKRHLYKFCLAAFIFYIIQKLIPTEDYFEAIEDDRKMKIKQMELSIRSAMNQGECHHPNLPIDNPEIMKFYKKTNPIDCGNSFDDWVMCENSICYVKPIHRPFHNHIMCTYTDLIRKDDHTIQYGQTIRTKKPYILKQSDFVKVVCKAGNGKSWSGIVFDVRTTVKRSMPTSYEMYGAKQKYPLYNVLMLGFDSMSRNAFIRKLPNTYNFLMNELKATVLTGYNIIGDGTPQALVPLLTGYTELELPETRHRMRNSVNVNAYPLIWYGYAKQGYITSYNEDMPKYGTFTYRMNGFSTQPVDHYLRTFYVAVDNLWKSKHSRFCIGHQPAHMTILDYTRKIMSHYTDNPRFIFSFHGALSHDSINLIGAIDDDLREWLSQRRKDSLLNNTILIMMSDHGNRFSSVRNTLQGKQEERLPFFSFAFPDSFKRRFPQQYQRFIENSVRLTTPFDVHATLEEILKMQIIETKSSAELISPYEDWAEDNHLEIAQPMTYAPERAISLFDHIPKNRSCADAYIEPHWCACLNWQALPLNVSANYAIAEKMAESIISAINNFTAPYRELCAMLKLKSINWAMALNPRQELLNFKKTKDFDGFVADLTDNMKINVEMYQVQITTLPGNAMFEASVENDPRTHVTITRISQVSRINKYDDQANCIYDINPELRKFCYCVL